MIMGAIIAGDLESLGEIAQLLEGFPNGQDDFLRRSWITNAVDAGPLEVVRWMLSRGASVVFQDPEGSSILHSAIERTLPHKYEILRALIAAGADLNAHGPNDWTPTHYAAVRNDVEALKILLDAGANLSIRTRIDDYTTPLEEAISLGNAEKAVAYLKAFDIERQRREHRARARRR